MYVYPARSTLVLFAAVLISGCQCGGTLDVECLSDGDCSPSAVCRDNACVPSGEDLPDGGGNGNVDVCVEDCGTGCCTSGFQCENAECHVTCAPDTTRCGDLGSESCCTASELCYLGACITPGAPCATSAECGVDQYCDPAVGLCLPRGSGNDCEFTPSGQFAPSVLWNSVVTSDAFTQVMMTPVVIDVNGDETPDVLANYFSISPGYNGPGVMRALNGADGAILWTTPNDPATNIHPPASIAAADLDGSGKIVAVTVAADNRLIAFDASSGDLLWKSQDASGAAVSCAARWGGPAIADLDGDGDAEIVCGLAAFDHTGKVLWNNGLGAGSTGPLSVVVDLDGDGRPEITDGAKAFRHDGTPLGWTGSGYGGLLAVGDFVDGTGTPVRDGKPELVVVHGGRIALVNGQTGEPLIAPSTLPSWNGTSCVVGGGTTGNGGPPTVADFDGDGQPEIGVANLACYTMFEVVSGAEGLSFSVAWSKKVQDQSSSVTGSSVFDFDGDARAEVVYADEIAVHVFDGQTGAEVFSAPHCSGTTYEYPVIVDVNGNGRADIVLAENTYGAAGLGCAADATAGIKVLRDGMDNWVNTRAIWNQHTYHVTNVCDGRDQVCGGPGAAGNTYGRVPRNEPANWSFNNAPAGSTAPPLNNFRQNVQGEGLFNAPDLTGRDLVENSAACPTSIAFQVRVVNQGALGVLAGIPVAFYEDGPLRELLAVGYTQQKLLPGQSEVVMAIWTPPTGKAFPIRLVAVVDDDGTGASSSSECVEGNNEVGPINVWCGSPIN